MEFICIDCKTTITSYNIKCIDIKWVPCPFCKNPCIPSEKTNKIDIENLPWACCGAKVPAGEKCSVCGDKE